MWSFRKRGLNRLILLLDAIVIWICAFLALILHPYFQAYFPFVKDPIDLRHYIFLTIVWTPIWIGFVVVFQLQRVFDRPMTRGQLIGGIAKLHLMCLLAMSIILFLTQLRLNRSLVLLFFASSFLLMYCVRSIIIFSLNYQYKHGHGRQNILLVGDMGEQMAEFIGFARTASYPPRFLGRLGMPDSVPPVRKPASDELEILGSVAILEDYLHRQPTDQVVFFSPWNNPAVQKTHLDVCEELGIPAYFSVDLDQPSQSAPRFSIQYEKPFILFDISPKRPDLIAVKHAADVVVALILLILLSPVLLVASLLILFSMGRPILFFQTRAGRFGREFQMIKFRTMALGAEQQRDDLLEKNEMRGPVFKLSNDPRVTKLGLFFRHWSIDELPQLLNVVSGTMSLVGPRPLPILEQQEIKGWRRRRLSMKPGISGLWQVSGRSDVDFEQWMKLDLHYIDNWSLKFDLSIFFKTFGAVLRRRGAR